MKQPIAIITRSLIVMAMALAMTACNDNDDPQHKYDTQLFNEGGLMSVSTDLDGVQTSLQGLSYTVTWYWDRNVADVTFQGLTLGANALPSLTIANVPFTMNSDGTRTISGSNLKTYQNGVAYPLTVRSFTLKAIDRYVTEPMYIYPNTTFPQYLASVYANIKVDDYSVTSIPRLLYFFAKTAVSPVSQPEEAIYNSDYLPVGIQLFPETTTANVQIYSTRLYYQQHSGMNVLIKGVPFTTSGDVVTLAGGEGSTAPWTFDNVVYNEATQTFTLNALTERPALPLSDIKGTAAAVGRLRLTFTCSPDDQAEPSSYVLDGYMLPTD